MGQVTDEFYMKEAARPRSFGHGALDVATDYEVNVQSLGGVPFRNPELGQVATVAARSSLKNAAT